MPQYTFSYEDADGYEHDITVPAKYAVCSRCRGTGKHDHDAFSNGISGEQFAEDPDFAEAYYRGDYDVICTVCRGLRVVPEPDLDQMTEDQKRHFNAYLEYAAEQAQMDAADRHTRRMESGGYY